MSELVTEAMVEAAARAMAGDDADETVWWNPNGAGEPPEPYGPRWTTHTAEARTVLTAVAPLIAERERERVLKPDMFWNAEDPEYSVDSIQELFDNHFESGHVYEAQQAVRVESVFVFRALPDDDQFESDVEIQVFATREEADAAAIRARKP